MLSYLTFGLQHLAFDLCPSTSYIPPSCSFHTQHAARRTGFIPLVRLLLVLLAEGLLLFVLMHMSGIPWNHSKHYSPKAVEPAHQRGVPPEKCETGATRGIRGPGFRVLSSEF